MGAGISDKDMKAIMYRRLKRLQYELESAGVNTVYKRFELVFFEGDGITFPHFKGDGGFNIKYRVLRASNGETAGLLSIFVSWNGSSEYYGFGEKSDGDFAKGLLRIKQLFSTTLSASQIITEANQRAGQTGRNITVRAADYLENGTLVRPGQSTKNFQEVTQ